MQGKEARKGYARKGGKGPRILRCIVLLTSLAVVCHVVARLPMLRGEITAKDALLLGIRCATDATE